MSLDGLQQPEPTTTPLRRESPGRASLLPAVLLIVPLRAAVGADLMPVWESTIFLDTIFDCIGRCIAARLRRPLRGCEPFAPSDPAALRRVLQPGDVLLVDGNQRLSSAIKYLTQSTWSHAALYIGEALASAPDAREQRTLIEANIEDGVVAVPLSKYVAFNIRICRPVGLTSTDRRRVIEFMIAHLGCG